MRWIEAKITTVTEAVEAISHILTDMGINGIMIDDPKDILNQKKNSYDWDYIDEELLENRDLDTVIMTIYLPENTNHQETLQNMQERLQNIATYLPIGTGSIEVADVDEEDWAHSWKKYYKPLKIGNNIVIKPSWEEYEAGEEDKIIELDPGMAFGTGTHETTSMCIELLEKYISVQDTVLDIGCGSGILSIVSGKLEAQKVIGVDLDPASTKVAKENVDRNQLSSQVQIRHGNLLDVVSEKGNVVVANIIADVIIHLASIVPEVMEPGGVFISSGIILERLEQVKAAIEQGPYEILEVQKKGEWAAIAAKMKE